MIRNAYLLRGKLKKEVFDMNTSIVAFRERCEKGASRYAKAPDGIKIVPQTLDGIYSEWLIPDGAPKEKLILYLHGGGYVSGSCNDHRGFVAKLAKNTGISCIVYEYRLAPENPFPAAIDDSVKVYNWLLLNGFYAGNIIFAGESAGGGLCLATLLKLKDSKITMPKAAVAISPWTDLSCSSKSYQTKNRWSPAPLNSWYVFSNHYVGNQSTHNPFISPLFGDLRGLPPLYINSAVDDELYEDGEKFYLRAKESEVNVTFKAGIGMVHCYPLLAPMFPEATEAMNEIVKFIQFHCSEPNRI